MPAARNAHTRFNLTRTTLGVVGIRGVWEVEIGYFTFLKFYTYVYLLIVGRLNSVS